MKADLSGSIWSVAPVSVTRRRNCSWYLSDKTAMECAGGLLSNVMTCFGRETVQTPIGSHEDWSIERLHATGEADNGRELVSNETCKNKLFGYGQIKVSGQTRFSAGVVILALMFALVIKIVTQIVTVRFSCNSECARCSA
jgi:hypothetical protein